MHDRQQTLRRPGAAAPPEDGAKPRVLIVGHGGAASPGAAERKWLAVERRVTLRLITEAESEGEPLRPVRPRRLFRRVRPLFYVRLPLHLARELRGFRPQVVIAQSPYEGAIVQVVRRTMRSSAALVVEVHGDWRTASRDYGSHLRRLAAPIADRVARYALRSADAVRAVGPSMARLAEGVTSRPADAIFPTYFDAEAFFSTPAAPVPSEPRFVWVGTLQRYKNPRMLAAAWPTVVERVPEAKLLVVGSGPEQAVIDDLVARYPDSVSTEAHVDPAGISGFLDGAIALVLPSLSEGLPRVAIEAFARGRPVVGTRAGGIPDLVVHERNGLLVPPNEPRLLAEAMVRLAQDREFVARLGRQATETVRPYRIDPDDYSASLLSLVQSTIMRTHRTN